MNLSDPGHRIPDEPSGPYEERKYVPHPCCPGLERGWTKIQNPTTWETKNHRILVFAEMSRRHLLLVLRLLIRRASYDRARACNETLRFTCAFFSDNNDEAAGQIYEQTWKDRVCKHYKPILAEARGRDLKNASEKVIDAYGDRCDRLGLAIECAGIAELMNKQREKEGKPPIEVQKPVPHWSRR